MFQKIFMKKIISIESINFIVTKKLASENPARFYSAGERATNPSVLMTIGVCGKIATRYQNSNFFSCHLTLL